MKWVVRQGDNPVFKILPHEVHEMFRAPYLSHRIG
jgi:hypothetical protein